MPQTLESRILRNGAAAILSKGTRHYNVGTPGEPWELDAKCAEIGMEPFFPEGSGKSGRFEQIRRVACASCEVRATCLNEALATEEDGDRFGMFGGLDPKQRAELVHAAPTDRDAILAAHGFEPGTVVIP